MSTPFADPRLELAVRAALPHALPHGAPPPLASLTRLSAVGRGIRRLGGISALSELRFVDLSDNPLTSTAELGANAKLVDVALRKTSLLTVEGLAGLPDLESLDLYTSRILDIRALAGAPALRSLDLSHCIVRDLGPLASLARLESLSLGNPSLHMGRRALYSAPDLVRLDLSALAGLTSLRQLRLYGVAIESAAVFDDLINLEELVLERCEFDDKLHGLRRLPRLELLSLADCKLRDLDVLVGQARLRTLILDGAELGNLTPLCQLESLEHVSLRGAEFDGGAGVDRLIGHPRVRELRLDNRRIKPE